MILTLKQQKFINAYCGSANGNASEAVRQAGYDTQDSDTIRAIAYENLTKPNVKQAIEDKKQDFARRLDAEIGILLTHMLEIAKNPDARDSDRIKAITDLLDRAGLGAKKEVQQDVTIVSETRHTQEIAKRARELMKNRLKEQEAS